MAGFFYVPHGAQHRAGLHPSELIGSERGASATSYGFSGSVPLDMWLGSRFVPRESASTRSAAASRAFLLSIVLTQWIDLLDLQDAQAITVSAGHAQHCALGRPRC
jgi:hypothetical protein